MNIREEIIEILDGIFDFDEDETVFLDFSLTDDLQLNEEELETMLEEINERFSLSLSPDMLVYFDTIADIVDYVIKKTAQ